MSTEKSRERGGSFLHDFAKTVANLFSSPEPSSPSSMLRLAGRRLRHLCCRLRWPVCPRRSKTKVTIMQRKQDIKLNHNHQEPNSVKANGHADTIQPIRIATFNAAMFSMAPAVPTATVITPVDLDIRGKTANDRPTKGILKQQKFSASNRRVSINLPEDEISVERSRQLRDNSRGKAPAVSHSFSFSAVTHRSESWRFSERSVLDVLKEAGADVIALQNVKAEEEKGMKPLSDLADGLGMNYVFAESWAPEYGNAILSKWPIKNWRVQKICDDTDFRCVQYLSDSSLN